MIQSLVGLGTGAGTATSTSPGLGGSGRHLLRRLNRLQRLRRRSAKVRRRRRRLRGGLGYQDRGSCTSRGDEAGEAVAADESRAAFTSGAPGADGDAAADGDDPGGSATLRCESGPAPFFAELLQGSTGRRGRRIGGRRGLAGEEREEGAAAVGDVLVDVPALFRRRPGGEHSD